ncbi:vanadium-dependent haloperoxidase [Streptomyces broussonetiae]|uniref:Vanadium-dependent haloperoxidase n=1 Tax=Streptomyces broussonetiae TaxID=2686304 RepID=A0ABV5EJX5_9ACTN
MTTSGRSPVTGSSPRRRSLLVGATATAAAVTLGASPAAAAAAAAGDEPAPGLDFDFDTDNFIRDLIITRANGVFPEEGVIGPMDASIYIWITTLFQLSWFDALAPYHPTAVGIHSRIARRPASEATTNRNKNIAGLYASLRVLEAFFAERVPVMKAGFTAVGLDPEDRSEDPATPIGIGNIAGKAIVRAHAHDGMNHAGDIGRKYHGKPYEDYTGYQPVNSAYKVVNPSRWQPNIHPHQRRVGGGPGDKGIWVIQKFVTPQLRLVKAYTYRNPGQFKLAAPDHSTHTNTRKYKRSVDEILSASANLTDEQKIKAEWFDNKLAGIALAPGAAAESHNLDLDGWVQLYAVTSLARFDDLIAAWYMKNKYDAVRPFTAVRHVYGRSKVSAWGGVGKGTVNDMPATEWESYLPVGDHPEYPSGSTTLCAAEAQAARRFLGDNVLDWRYDFPAGSLLTEPGQVPAKDTQLHWRTWDDFNRDCADSRVWGGVHFQTTVDRSLEFGAQFGDRAYDFLMRYINGDVKN